MILIGIGVNTDMLFARRVGDPGRGMVIAHCSAYLVSLGGLNASEPQIWSDIYMFGQKARQYFNGHAQYKINSYNIFNWEYH